MSVIETEALTKTFGREPVVDRLDLAVGAGEAYGLLGPNGAGKTTTIRMLSTLLASTSGVARVCGFDVAADPREVRRRIGYVMQTVAWQVNRFMTARELIEVEAALHHVPRRNIRAAAQEALELVGLESVADRLIAEFSGGMHKRLDLASGLLHKPEVLILDEPTLGLDVQSRHRIWEYVGQLRDEGVTILLATNYLDEADRLCNRLTIIDHGREVVTGSPEDLKSAVGGDVVQVSAPDVAAFAPAIEQQSWVEKVAATGDRELHIYVREAASAIPELMRLAQEHSITLERITYTRPTLDDVFLLHTGRELRDTEVSS